VTNPGNTRNLIVEQVRGTVSSTGKARVVRNRAEICFEERRVNALAILAPLLVRSPVVLFFGKRHQVTTGW
jgi:hypothetical protein